VGAAGVIQRPAMLNCGDATTDRGSNWSTSSELLIIHCGSVNGSALVCRTDPQIGGCAEMVSNAWLQLNHVMTWFLSLFVKVAYGA